MYTLPVLFLVDIPGKFVSRLESRFSVAFSTKHVPQGGCVNCSIVVGWLVVDSGDRCCCIQCSSFQRGYSFRMVVVCTVLLKADLQGGIKFSPQYSTVITAGAELAETRYLVLYACLH